MRLHKLEIHNYKSLRNVAIEPTPLSVFVGPNSAGKTNLADAIDFLRHVYEWGLEKAVAYKGGFESIRNQDRRRSMEPICFKVVLEVPWSYGDLLRMGWDKGDEPGLILIDHSFKIRSQARDGQSSFGVTSERIVASHRDPPGSPFHEFRRITREAEKVEVQDQSDGHNPLRARSRKELARISELELQGGRLETELLFAGFGWPNNFSSSMSALRVFQLDPRSCREPGVPTPNPDLDGSGRNLPVALDHLKKDFPQEYDEVLAVARTVMPSLEAIETGRTHTRSLALFIKEQGIDNLWTSEDISAGTIQTIALLVAAFDPRAPLVVIEEPENSVHPWALRNLVEAFRLASEKKQILLTTHSPILIDQVRPEEVWVVQKPGTETKVDPLLSLDSSLRESWGQGKFTLSEYLDSGAVPEAVPAVNS
jgi:predicted ATPase